MLFILVLSKLPLVLEDKSIVIYCTEFWDISRAAAICVFQWKENDKVVKQEYKNCMFYVGLLKEPDRNGWG